MRLTHTGVETVLDGLQAPQGILVLGDMLYVVDVGAKELIEYDPGLAALCREVFGDTELTYTKPATRLTGHMEGYDPGEAPTFGWPERLNKAKAEIRKKAEARSKG